MKYSFKAMIALCLSIIVFCTSIPTSRIMKADTTFPKREVSMLVLYDESYCEMMSDFGISDYQKRLRQVVEMAMVPYENVWNITVSTTVLPYEQVLGQAYASNVCPGLWSVDPESYGGKDWIYNGQCNCTDVCFQSLSDPGHHNCAYRLLCTLNKYQFEESPYDVTCAFTGHSLCYQCNSSGNGYVAGLALYKKSSFVCLGSAELYKTQQVDGNVTLVPAENSPCVENFMSNVAVFQHEFSHLFGTLDGRPTGFDSSNCNVNTPCVMSGGFGGIVSVSDLWCTNCKSSFEINHFDRESEEN